MSELTDEVEELFEQVIALAPAERAPVLNRSCIGKPGLRALVEDLIEADREATAEGFLEDPPEIEIDQVFLGCSPSASENGEMPFGPGPEATVGAEIGDFRIVREIGRGGMGIVFEAWQKSIGRRVALKLLQPGWAWAPSRRLRFEREGQAGGRLQHPGIVAVYEIGEHEGTPFLAQEFVEGARSLADQMDDLRREPELPPSYWVATARLFLEIAEALAFAHRAGVVHRDVKPSNVLLTPDGHSKVADFGLARLEGAESITGTGEFAGTPFYMSPEQITGKGIGPQSDVFSLGATLYEALTLTRPFQGDTREEIVREILELDPADPRKLRSRVPRDLAVICLKALEKRPERRFASMADMVDDLRRYLRHEPIRAKSPGLVAQASKWGRRHPALASTLVLGTGALVVISLLLVRSLRDQKEILRLSDVKRLELLAEEANELWPAYPDQVPSYERWLEDARTLAARISLHKETLRSMRNEATQEAPEGESPTWLFSDTQDQWRHDVLTQLVDGLDSFASEGGLVSDVEERLAFARTIGQRSMEGPEARELWEVAIASIANTEECPAYGGLRIAPQMGLLPVGRDPGSGLWEFAHLQSGTVPDRDPETGKLLFSEENGIVFVLIPGGGFLMGSQDEDPQAPNYYPLVVEEEAGIHEVELAPFFLSKYEMTQAQWLAVTGVNPSLYDPSHEFNGKRVTLSHPVEQVNWDECDRVLRQAGLQLPTEAQWEYAARAGTTTPWWTGENPLELQAAANIADVTYCTTTSTEADSYASVADDGYAVHAPVDWGRPNPFGIFNVLGNVWEWCRDHYTLYEHPPREGDGLRTGPGRHQQRMARGGAYDSDPRYARSATRSYLALDSRDDRCGVRPARRITP